MDPAFSSPLRLHPEAQPYDSGWLPVPDGHRVYFEQRGAADGIPALVLHGGPGSGCAPSMARFFDPRRYRIILSDQRGAGRSEPHGDRRGNTTADLLADLRRLQDHLGLDRCLLMGGSWGATLAVLAAATAPERAGGLLLRNPFLARRQDIDWFFHGARAHHPFDWQRWRTLGAPEEREALLPWLTEHFDPPGSGTDPAGLAALAMAWWHWENALAGVRDAIPPEADALPRLIHKYRLQLHYFRHGCFLGEDTLLGAASRIGNLPTLILQGSADHVCPEAGAASLHRALSGSGLCRIEGVGHDPYAPAMVDATVAALDRFAATGRFDTPGDTAASY